MSLGAIALETFCLDHRVGWSQSPSPLAPRKPPKPAKATRVIYLHMSGGPPNLDIFDYKPELVKRNGEPCPDSFLAGREFAFTTGVPKLMGTPRTFQQYGKAGMWMSDAVPHFHTIADEITLIHTMHTEQFNHAPAELLLFTGQPRQGRPSMGSWVTYGLGTENQDLPGFVTLISSGVQPSGGQACWGSGFLYHRFIKAFSAEAKETGPVRIGSSRFPAKCDVSLWTRFANSMNSNTPFISTVKPRRE